MTPTQNNPSMGESGGAEAAKELAHDLLVSHDEPQNERAIYEKLIDHIDDLAGTQSSPAVSGEFVEAAKAVVFASKHRAHDPIALHRLIQEDLAPAIEAHESAAQLLQATGKDEKDYGRASEAVDSAEDPRVAVTGSEVGGEDALERLMRSHRRIAVSYDEAREHDVGCLWKIDIDGNIAGLGHTFTQAVVYALGVDVCPACHGSYCTPEKRCWDAATPTPKPAQLGGSEAAKEFTVTVGPDDGITVHVDGEILPSCERWRPFGPAPHDNPKVVLRYKLPAAARTPPQPKERTMSSGEELADAIHEANVAAAEIHGPHIGSRAERAILAELRAIRIALTSPSPSHLITGRQSDRSTVQPNRKDI